MNFFFLNLCSYNHEYLDQFILLGKFSYIGYTYYCMLNICRRKQNKYINVDFEYKYIVYMLGNIWYFFTQFIYLPFSDNVFNNFSLELFVEVPIWIQHYFWWKKYFVRSIFLCLFEMFYLITVWPTSLHQCCSTYFKFILLCLSVIMDILRITPDEFCTEM